VGRPQQLREGKDKRGKKKKNNFEVGAGGAVEGSKKTQILRKQVGNRTCRLESNGRKSGPEKRARRAGKQLGCRSKNKGNGEGRYDAKSTKKNSNGNRSEEGMGVAIFQRQKKK